jgi:polar amino acid transport system substrate-binding protein
MRRLGQVLGPVLIAAFVVGCGSGSNGAERLALAALGTPVPPSSPSTRSNPALCGTASLRPPATMPAPGAMPARSYMATIHRRGYLIAGVDQNTLLFEYFNPVHGQLEGFEIDLLRQLAKAIFGDPNKIKFVAVTTDERIAAVRSGAVDVVADAFTITCERKKKVDFSTVYYHAGQRLLVPSDSSAHSVSDLGAKKVCATKTSTSIQTLESLFPKAMPYPVGQRTDCLVALQEGLVSGITSDDSILLGFKAQDPYTKIVGGRFADEPYGIAISQSHPGFVRFVNGVLAQMRADGQWAAIYRRWLGKFSTTPSPPPAQYDG